MASAKSQPLHNFDLPLLKWNKEGNPSGQHQRCRSIKSPSIRVNNTSSPSPLRHSPLRDSVSATPLSDSAVHGDDLVKQSQVLEEPSSSTDNNGEKKSRATEVDGNAKRSKFPIRIPCKNLKSEKENPPQEEQKKMENNVGSDEVQEGGKTDEEIKIWNLRPRKPFRKSQAADKAHRPLIDANKSGEKEADGELKKKKEEEKKRKLSISIALTKNEIEEDIFSLIGLNPARRPKKRPRNIQKQVDAVFPGLWLVSITPDTYKVPENSLKG